jgi:hypothetical protein
MLHHPTIWNPRARSFLCSFCRLIKWKMQTDLLFAALATLLALCAATFVLWRRPQTARPIQENAAAQPSREISSDLAVPQLRRLAACLAMMHGNRGSAKTASEGANIVDGIIELRDMSVLLEAMERSDASVDELWAALSFTLSHSKLYSDLAKDDSATTLVGCFFPEGPEGGPISMSRSQFIAHIITAYRLHLEHEAWLDTLDLARFLRIGDHPFYRTLQGHSEDDTVALREVIDSLQLPLEPLRLHLDIAEVKGQYHAACAAYNPTTATVRRPRLADFVHGHERLNGLLTRSLAPLVALHPTCRFKDRIFHSLDEIEEALCMGSDRTSAQNDLARALDSFKTGRIHDYSSEAFSDGAWGEPLAEFGGTASYKRWSWYSCGCIMAGRDVPPAPRVWADLKLRLPPAVMAAMLGKLEALVALPTSEVKNNSALAVVAAMRFGHLDVAKWLENTHAAASGSLGLLASVSQVFSDRGPSSDTDVCHAVVQACRAGHHEVVNWALDNLGLLQRFSALRLTELLKAALETNNLSMAQHIHARCGIPALSEATAFGAEHKNREMVRWARERGVGWHEHTLASALKTASGDLHLYNSLREQGCPFGGRELAAVCTGFGGDTRILDRLVSDGAPTNRAALSELAVAACKEGQRSCLEWIAGRFGFRGWRQERQILVPALRSALRFRSVDCLTFLVEDAGISPVGFNWEPDWFDDHMGWDARIPCLEARDIILPGDGGPIAPGILLEWLVSLIGPNYVFWEVIANWDIPAIRALGRAGHHLPEFRDRMVSDVVKQGDAGIPILTALIEDAGWRGPQVYPKGVCRAAARSGSVRMMQFVRSHGCEWDNEVLTAAAEANRVPFLRWLVAGMPAWEWPEDTVKKAREFGSWEAAQFAVDNGARDAPLVGETQFWYSWE